MIKRERGGSQGVEREGGTGGRGKGLLVRRVGLEDGSENGKPGGHLGFHPWPREAPAGGRLATDRGGRAVERGGESFGTRRERVRDDADWDVGGCTRLQRSTGGW